MKVCLYHKNCNDGLFAAYACWLKFRNEAIYIPVNYKPIQDMEPQEALDYIFNPEQGSKIDAIGNSQYRVSQVTPEAYKDIDLYVVDYSFPVSHFKHHGKLFKSVTVLDHHDSAIKSYLNEYIGEKEGSRITITFDNPNLNVIFATEESGAKLAYSYLFPDETIPEIIELVSDRDLWKFKLKNTKAFHSGIKALNIENFFNLNLTVKSDLSRVLDIGEVFENELTSRISKVKKSGLTPISINLLGHTYSSAIINSYPDIASDLCSSILSEGYSIAIVYSIGKNNTVSYSVRSIPGVDSSIISKKHRGGGHQQASGFTSNLDYLFFILNSRGLEIN